MDGQHRKHLLHPKEVTIQMVDNIFWLSLTGDYLTPQTFDGLDKCDSSGDEVLPPVGICVIKAVAQSLPSATAFHSLQLQPKDIT